LLGALPAAKGTLDGSEGFAKDSALIIGALSRFFSDSAIMAAISAIGPAIEPAIGADSKLSATDIGRGSLGGFVKRLSLPADIRPTTTNNAMSARPVMIDKL